MTANEIALTAVKALDSKKGQDIKFLETGHLTTLADYFVLFNEHARELYDLERLWSDAAPVDLSGVLTEN